MEFITYPEFRELQNILINNTILQTYDGDDYSTLLTNCGLGKYCSRISLLNKPSPSIRFIPSFCKTLSEVHIIFEASERLGLIVFLEHIMQLEFPFSHQEKELISHIIKKWDKWQSTNNQKPQKKQFNDMLAQGRQESPINSVVQSPIKVDRTIIVNYDLEQQMSRFRTQVQYQGAFVFTVGGNVTILEEYIIERIKQELKQKTERQTEPHTIKLYQQSILTSKDIEQNFIKQKQLERFTDLFNEHNTDILLIVWNYDIPPKRIKPLAKSFWEEITTPILPLLKKQNRCFIMVWANVGKSPLNGCDFTVLPTPDKFEMCELLPWFHNQLKIKGVGEDSIEHYLNRLKNQCGHLLGTYQEINQIIRELKGSFRLYE